MAKRYCTKCGAELPDNVKFCPNCGTPVLPEDDNKLDQTEPAGYQNTTSVPDFHSDQTEDTQNLNNTAWTQQNNYYGSQESSPYNNPDYADTYEKPKKHVGLIILIIIIVICVGGFFFLLFAKPEFLTDTLHLPFGNKETAAEQVTSSKEKEETEKPEKKEKSDTETEKPESTSLPEDTSTLKTTATPKPTSGVLKTTDDNTKTVTPVTPAKQGTGTVYISESANPRRIKVRTGPSQSATDTGGRKYNGDVVTVYETKQAEGYTWYRIGDNLWIAGNGSSFGVSMN